MEQTILNPKFLLSVILALSLIMISPIVLILHLYRRINVLRDYCDDLYNRINLSDKYQKEDHDIMVKLIEYNKELLNLLNKNLNNYGYY